MSDDRKPMTKELLQGMFSAAARGLGGDASPMRIAYWITVLETMASQQLERAQIAEFSLTTTRADLERAVGMLLDGTMLINSPPEARERWKARVEASGVLRVREPLAAPPKPGE